jgi:hypothetical protein
MLKEHHIPAYTEDREHCSITDVDLKFLKFLNFSLSCSTSYDDKNKAIK